MEKIKNSPEWNNALQKFTEIDAFAKHINQLASFNSVLDAAALKVLDSYKNQIAYIESVFDSSTFKAIESYQNRITSIGTPLEILSKSDSFAASVRNVIEANKSFLAMTNANVSSFLEKNQQQTQEIMKSLRITLNSPGMVSASLAAQTTLANLNRFPMGAAINATESLQDTLRTNLETITTNYKTLFEFTDHQPSTIEKLEPELIQFPPYEVFHEAKLLEQITVPQDEQAVQDEFEIIPFREESTLQVRLGEIDVSFPALLQGARDALNTDNPERARHVTVSLRELLGRVLRTLAPKDKLIAWSTNADYYDAEGKPTWRARLLYIFREINSDPLYNFVDVNVTSVLTLNKALNAATHAIPCRVTDRQLHALVDRTESCLLFLLCLNSANE